MTDYMVTNITRDRGDVDRRIDALKGPWFGPSHIDTVIADIESGRNRYYVNVGPTFADNAYLEIKLSIARRKYLRTIPDGRFDNNLYALPEI